jgi:hypothetical protein
MGFYIQKYWSVFKLENCKLSQVSGIEVILPNNYLSRSKNSAFAECVFEEGRVEVGLGICYSVCMRKNFIEVVGWLGVVAFLVPYALVSFSLLSPESFSYQFLNVVGAVGLVCVAYSKKDHQSVIVNFIWGLIAITAIVKITFY